MLTVYTHGIKCVSCLEKEVPTGISLNSAPDEVVSEGKNPSLLFLVSIPALAAVERCREDIAIK